MYSSVVVWVFYLQSASSQLTYLAKVICKKIREKNILEEWWSLWDASPFASVGMLMIRSFLVEISLFSMCLTNCFNEATASGGNGK